jgi:hypothetical protein
MSRDAEIAGTKARPTQPVAPARQIRIMHYLILNFIMDPIIRCCAAT